MDSFVVRIYGRDPKGPHKSVGVVEWAEREGERAFHDLNELIDILASPGPKRGSPKSGKKRKDC